MKFVDLTTIIPDLVLDLRYSSTNNICNKVISTLNKPYLLREPADALIDVANQLRKKECRLVVWDAGRTRATQTCLRLVCASNEYVAEISKHNSGIAIDVTLANSDGQLLDMGTDFDDFSLKSRSDNRDFDTRVLQNREILFSAMEIAGFMQLPSEWWHFEFQNNNSEIKLIRIEDYVFA